MKIVPNRHSAQVLLVFSVGWVCPSAGQSLQVLQPTRIHKLSAISTQLSNHQVLEVSGLAGRLWFTVSSPAQNKVFLVQMPVGSQSQPAVTILPDVPNGLAATQDGAAVMIVSGKKGSIHIYDGRGSLGRTVSVPCYGADALLSFSGDPATLCGDGLLTRYRQPASIEYHTWGGRGKLCEPLGETRLAIIDPFTAQIVFEDLSSHKLSISSVRLPEAEAALTQVDASMNRTRVAMKPTDPPLARPMIVADTAVHGEDLYLLIWPYHPSTGPAVARLDASGQLIGRYRLSGVGSASGVMRKIDVLDGNIFLTSSRGSVYQYRLPPLGK